MSWSPATATLVACALIACGTTPGTFDSADVGDSGGTDVGASDGTEDSSADVDLPRPSTPEACSRFDELANDGQSGPFEVGGISRSVVGTCFVPLESPGETWDGVWSIAVPPRTALDITARYDGRGQPSWGISAATPCAESVDASCRWASEIYNRSQEGVRVTYLANTSDDWEFWLLRAVFFAAGVPLQGNLELEVVPVELDPAAGCDNALPLEAGVEVRPGRGASDIDCDIPNEVVFYEITVPPMSYVDESNGGFGGFGRPECACTGLQTTRNATSQEARYIVTPAAGFDAAYSYNPQPLATNAICENALPLVVGESQRALLDAGGPTPAFDSACVTYGDSEHPVWWTVEIPARSTAEVRAVMTPAGFEQANLLYARPSCDDPCFASAEAVNDEVALQIDNPSDVATVVYVAASAGFLPEPNIVAELSVSFSPFAPP